MKSHFNNLYMYNLFVQTILFKKLGWWMFWVKMINVHQMITTHGQQRRSQFFAKFCRGIHIKHHLHQSKSVHAFLSLECCPSNFLSFWASSTDVILVANSIATVGFIIFVNPLKLQVKHWYVKNHILFICCTYVMLLSVMVKNNFDKVCKV